MRTLLLIAVAGLAAQLVDGGLGMGFGVTSTTLLITLATLTPAAASAVVHTAELGTTLASGLSHWRFGNVDWKAVAQIGLPGAVGAFGGATVLSHLSTDTARPVMAAILALVGTNLVLRFSRGKVRRSLVGQPHSPGLLAALGLGGGFVDATGGGGWGPVTTSTLLTLGRTSPRRIIGTVNTAEFLVALAATTGFAIGLWDALIANLAAVITLLAGGVVAAPLAAWMVTRINAVALGGIVGTLLVVINAPLALAPLGFGPAALWGVRIVVLLVGVALSARGILRARRNRPVELSLGHGGPVSSDIEWVAKGG